MTLLPLGLAVLGAFLNAAGDLLQRRSTRDEPTQRSGSLKLLLDLATRPGWLGGVVASLLGLCVHVVALSIGKIASVQPMLALELPLSVLGTAWLFGVRLARRDWVAIVLLTLGIAAFVFFLSPTGGDRSGVSGLQWAVGLGILGVLVAGTATVGAVSRSDLRAGLLGVASGVGYGTTAVLFSTAGAAAAGGLGVLVSTWQAYAAIVIGLVSFYLLQNSMNSGLLVATEPGLTLANPLVAVVWGLVVFGEHARTGPWLIGAGAGAVLLVVGTILLSRSPVLQASVDHGSGQGGDQDGGQDGDQESGRLRAGTTLRPPRPAPTPGER